MKKIRKKSFIKSNNIVVYCIIMIFIIALITIVLFLETIEGNNRTVASKNPSKNTLQESVETVGNSESEKEQKQENNNKTEVTIEQDNIRKDSTKSSEKKQPKQESIPEMFVATVEYSCPEGYTLSEMLCIKETIKPAEKRYYCSSGTLDGSYCIEETTKTVNITFDAKASCSNYSNTGLYNKCTCEKSGGDWSIVGCTAKTTRKTLANIEYYCNSTDLLSNGLCINKEYESPTTDYICPSGYTQDGMICYKY